MSRRYSYQSSTQYRSWRFTAEQIQQFRSDINQKYIDGIDKDNANLNEYIVSIKEEQVILSHYKKFIVDIATVLALPDNVYSTAIVYLNRFYLKKSVMDYNPKLIMICCVYLACKTEDNHLDIEHYSNKLGVKSTQITELELVIMECLQFHLTVYHPFRPLYGFLLDINEMSQQQQYSDWITPQTFQFDQLYNQCKSYIIKSLQSDCCFLYHPFQIALASLDLSWNQFDRYFQLKFNQNVNNTNNNNNNLKETINQIKTIIQTIPELPNKNEVAAIDKKLILLNKKLKRKGGSKKDKQSTKKIKKDHEQQQQPPQQVIPPTDQESVMQIDQPPPPAQ